MQQNATPQKGLFWRQKCLSIMEARKRRYTRREKRPLSGHRPRRALKGANRFHHGKNIAAVKSPDGLSKRPSEPLPPCPQGEKKASSPDGKNHFHHGNPESPAEPTPPGSPLEIAVHTAQKSFKWLPSWKSKTEAKCPAGPSCGIFPCVSCATKTMEKSRNLPAHK